MTGGFLQASSREKFSLNSKHAPPVNGRSPQPAITFKSAYGSVVFSGNKAGGGRPTVGGKRPGVLTNYNSKLGADKTFNQMIGNGRAANIPYFIYVKE
jgi:hypothetical protein